MTKSSAGQDGRSQAGSGRGPEREKDEFEAGTSYQPSTNQARDEPLPASHHDDGRQEESDPRGTSEPDGKSAPDGKSEPDDGTRRGK